MQEGDNGLWVECTILVQNQKYTTLIIIIINCLGRIDPES